MARFFKYKSSAELQADAQHFGFRLPLADDVSPLWQPQLVGRRTVGNRCCIQPMEGCDGTLDGRPDELTYRRYQRFGSGGAKLIWGEATAVADEGRMNPRQLWLHDGSASGMAGLLAQCRQAHRDAGESDHDLLVGLQLTHSGRYSYRQPLLATHCPLLDPLTKDKVSGLPVTSETPLLSDGDLRRIADQYVAAARLAWNIGCDFVDLKQCHRYLLSELLGARNREGDYGGDLWNRTRLVRDVIAAIRLECPELILASRINVYDGLPFRPSAEGEAVGVPVSYTVPVLTAFGVSADDPLTPDLNEPLQLVRWLAEWGIALLNVSSGNPYANPHHVRPAEFPPIDGYLAPEHPLLGIRRHFELTAAVQQAVPDVPVVGSGYTWLQEFFPLVGAANVAAGHCAFVGLGRGTLSQPDFVHQLKQHGRLNRKTICRTFSYCTNLMRTKSHPMGQYPTGCPPFDKEVYGPLWKEVETQRSAATPS
jgi:NADPH2 dehydrogenase